MAQAEPTTIITCDSCGRQVAVTLPEKINGDFDGHTVDRALQCAGWTTAGEHVCPVCLWLKSKER